MNRMDALLFDVDGTLVDTREDLAASANVLREQFGLPRVTTAEVVGWVGDGAQVLVARALGRPEQGAHEDPRVAEGLALFRDHYTGHMLERTQPYPGTLEGVRRLRETGRKLAVVSNKPRAMCVQILDALGFQGAFSLVLGGDSLPRKKPDPAPLLHALESLDVPPERALMVGDGAQDMRAGRAAGCATAAALWGFRSRAELEPTRPDYWLDSFAGLEELLAAK
jgi:phosphoglycolate phosphatase